MTKKIFILMLMMVFLVGTVSAFEFDNVLSYENNDMKVTITNAFGLGEELGTIELKSHSSVDEVLQFGYGKEEVVMYYDFDFKELYIDGLGEVYFVDQRTGKIIEKEYYFVEWIVKNIIVNDYLKVCNLLANGTNECYQEVIGTYEKEVWLWERLKTNNIPGKNVSIGLKTYVGKGDYIDAVWTIAGKKIKKHAVWSASLEADIIAYYTFDGNFGIDQEDDFFAVWNGTNNGATNTTGIIGSAFEFNGINQYISYGTNFPDLLNDYSINFWIYGDVCNDERVLYKNPDSFSFQTSAGAVRDELDSSLSQTCVTGEWAMYTLTYDKTLTTKTYYKNSGNPLTAIPLNNITSLDSLFIIGSRDGTGKFYNGKIDEVGFWDRTLSALEVIDLYNGGSAIQPPIGGPTINLDFPVNHTNFTTSNIVMNATIFDDTNITNVTLYLNNVGNETNTTAGLNNTLWTFDVVGFAEGDHVWNIEACNFDDECGNSSQRTFSVDTTKPATSVSDPNTTINFHLLNSNITFSWTANDTHLDVCQFDYEGANTTVTCGDDTTTFNITGNFNRNLIFYVNDTFGNMNSTNVSWQYRLFEYPASFSATTIEGSIETFVANVSIGNFDSLVSAIMTYNGTSKGVTSTSFAGIDYNYLNLSSTFEVITVSEDASVSFLWELTMDSSTQVNTTTRPQSVLNFGVDDCTVNLEVLYNFTIVDEKTQSKLDGNDDNTTGELNLQIFPLGSTTEIQSFSSFYNETNSFSVCLNSSLSSGESYNINVQVQYNADGYVSEFYHIQNDTLNNADFPTNITLFDLDEDSSEEFKITFKDASFLPVPNALIQIQRKYISEGLFKTVEIPKTDTDGETIAHLELEDVLYNFIVVKNGLVLATFNDFLVDCNTLLRECILNLNAVSSHVDIDDFTTLDDFTFTLTYNETSRVITSVFTIPSSTVSTVRLNATLLDSLGTTQVCSKQLISSSGTLTCTVPSNFGNASVIIQLYKNDVKQGDGVISLWQTPADIFGANQVFLLLFLYLTLIGVGISDSPIITLFSLMFGVFLAIGLNLIRIGGSGGGFIGAGATILWIIIALAMVLNKGGGRN